MLPSQQRMPWFLGLRIVVTTYCASLRDSMFYIDINKVKRRYTAGGSVVRQVVACYFRRHAPGLHSRFASSAARRPQARYSAVHAPSEAFDLDGELTLHLDDLIVGWQLLGLVRPCRLPLGVARVVHRPGEPTRPLRPHRDRAHGNRNLFARRHLPATAPCTAAQRPRGTRAPTRGATSRRSPRRQCGPPLRSRCSRTL